MNLEYIITRDKSIEDTFSNLDNVKELLSILSYIDHPISNNLSTVLQQACRFAEDDTVVKYLLENGANPNHLDINGHDAKYYIELNKNTLAGLMCLNEVNKYVDDFPKEDPNERKELGYRLIREEIARHKAQEKENEVLQELKTMIMEIGGSNG